MPFLPESIKAKLVMAFGGVAGIVVVLGGIALYSLTAATDRFTTFVHGINARAMLAARCRRRWSAAPLVRATWC